MDNHSEYLLDGVHPDLVRVIREASQSPQAFEVVQGLRSLEDEAKAVKSGHSTMMHSRHLPHQGDGLSRAVDVAALIDGKISWAPGREEEVYGQIWKQISESADKLKIAVTWGGSWKTFKDWGHIELSWKVYS